jgi:hypothetical protein
MERPLRLGIGLLVAGVILAIIGRTFVASNCFPIVDWLSCNVGVLFYLYIGAPLIAAGAVLIGFSLAGFFPKREAPGSP